MKGAVIELQQAHQQLKSHINNALNYITVYLVVVQVTCSPFDCHLSRVLQMVFI